MTRAFLHGAAFFVAVWACIGQTVSVPNGILLLVLVVADAVVNLILPCFSFFVIREFNLIS